MDDTSLLLLDDNDENIGWNDFYSGRDGVIFLIDCSNQNENMLQHVKDSFEMVEKVMMNGIIATGNTMVSSNREAFVRD